MEYLNIINDEYLKIASRNTLYPKFKVELLDPYDNPVSNIVKDVDGNNGGSISINYQQGVRRSCSISFIDNQGNYIPNDNGGIFWINSKFKLYIGLAVSKYASKTYPLVYSENVEDIILYDSKNGLEYSETKALKTEDIYWFSQGVFYITNSQVLHSNSEKKVTINGVDKFGFLTSETGYNQIVDTYKIPVGSKIYDAIKAILSLEVIPNVAIDSASKLLDLKFIDEITPYSINKSPNTYLGDILIELGNVLGSDVFYDTEGRFNLISGTTDISYNNKSALWSFSDVLPEYVNSNISYDYTKAINCVKVVGANINGVIVDYTAKNTNAKSPTRIDRIGEKYKRIDNSLIYSVERARELAEYTLSKDSILQLSINFTSTLLPHLDVNNIVEITDKYYKYDKQRFIIQSISMPFGKGETMSITATNVATLPYYNE